MVQDALFETRGAALVVTFNRPSEKNKYNADMAVQLYARLKAVTTDRNIRAVMLRGAGGNFMAGFDEGIYAGNLDTALLNANQLIQHYHSTIREMQAMDKPVLAVVDGRVEGVGMSFMLASDLVLASRETQFNCGSISSGLTPEGGMTHFLARKAGIMRASELLMINRDFDAVTAEKYNLVNSVLEDNKVHEESLALLDQLAQGPTRAYAGIRHLLQKSFEQDLNTQLGFEHTVWGASSRSFDFREALKARNEKRPPKFTGA